MGQSIISPGTIEKTDQGETIEGPATIQYLSLRPHKLKDASVVVPTENGNNGDGIFVEPAFVHFLTAETPEPESNIEDVFVKVENGFVTVLQHLQASAEDDEEKLEDALIHIFSITKEDWDKLANLISKAIWSGNTTTPIPHIA